jgi:hypothetical protein
MFFRIGSLADPNSLERQIWGKFPVSNLLMRNLTACKLTKCLLICPAADKARISLPIPLRIVYLYKGEG